MAGGGAGDIRRSAWLAVTDAERRRAPSLPRPFGRRPADEVQLTDRQREVLELVADGLENKEVAGVLGISEQAVKQQVSVLLRKFQVVSRAVLTRTAVTMQLLGTTGPSSDIPLEYLFDRAPVLIAMSRGPDHRFDIVNRAFRALFGEREYSDRTFAECFPDARGDMLAKLGSIYTTGETYRNSDREVRVAMADGSTRVLHLSLIAEPRKAADGSVDGIVFFGWDISEQVALRQQLQRVITEQQVLLQHLPVGVIYTDAEARPVLVNPVAERILGRTVDPERPLYEQLIGWNPRHVSTGDPLMPDESPAARAVAGWPFDEDLLISAPGGSRWIHVSARPVHDTEGKVTGSTLVLTERSNNPPPQRASER